MKTKKEIKAFVLKTLLPYKDNIDLCGTDNNSCIYLTPDGRKCALGKWMKKGEWQHYRGIASSVFLKYKKENVLLKPALDMGFSGADWDYIQRYHDTLAEGVLTNTCRTIINKSVSAIEKNLGIDLPELKFTLPELKFTLDV